MFIRTKHKLQEELTFEEVTEATAILYAAVQENLDAFVRDVACKNGPYLRKKMKKSEWSYEHFEVQAQLDEIESYMCRLKRFFDVW